MVWGNKPFLPEVVRYFGIETSKPRPLRCHLLNRRVVRHSTFLFNNYQPGMTENRPPLWKLEWLFRSIILLSKLWLRLTRLVPVNRKRKEAIVVMSADEQDKGFTCVTREHTGFLKRMWTNMAVQTRNSEKYATSNGLPQKQCTCGGCVMCTSVGGGEERSYVWAQYSGLGMSEWLAA